MTIIILSNGQFVKLGPQANTDYARSVMESELRQGGPSTGSGRGSGRGKVALRLAHGESLLQHVVNWLFRRDA